IREQLPDGFQRAEYLLAHGMIDMVVHRHELRDTLSRICRLLMASKALPKEQAKGLNGHAYINGEPVDDAIISPDSGAEDDIVIEAEPVADDERFEPPRADKREKAKREAEHAATRP